MNIRKPAMAVATIALAMVPAMATLSPARADSASPTPTATNSCADSTSTPAPTPTDPANTALIDLILEAFPNPVQCDARALLGGDFSMLLPLLSDLIHLTPTQLEAVLASLEGLAGLLPGASATPTASAPAATANNALYTGDGSALSSNGKPFGKAQLAALLKALPGGKLTGPAAFNLLLSAGL